MAKTGRPPTAQRAINKTELEKLLQLYPSEKETSDWFKVSMSSLERFIRNEYECSFDELRDKNVVHTKMEIKRAQIKKALAGDNTMLIWVGKWLLGQTEKVEVQELKFSSKQEALDKLLETADKLKAEIEQEKSNKE